MSCLIISKEKQIHLYHYKDIWIDSQMIDVIPTKNGNLYLLRAETNYSGFYFNTSNYEIMVNPIIYSSNESKYNPVLFNKVKPHSWFFVGKHFNRVGQVKVNKIVEHLNKLIGGKFYV